MKNYIFNKQNFTFNPELLNMLVPERHEDFRDYLFSIENNDENNILPGNWNNRQCFNRKLKEVLTTTVKVAFRS